MSKSRREKSKSETKAGMLGRNYGGEQTPGNEHNSADDLPETPKISKDKATQRETDKPVH